MVDIHTFDPDELAGIARSAGNHRGQRRPPRSWPQPCSAGRYAFFSNEAAVPADKLGWGWAGFAFGGWKKMATKRENVLQSRSPEILLQRRSYGCEARKVTEGPAGLVRVCRPSSVVGVRTRIGFATAAVAPRLQWIEVCDQPSVTRFFDCIAPAQPINSRLRGRGPFAARRLREVGREVPRRDEPRARDGCTSPAVAQDVVARLHTGLRARSSSEIATDSAYLGSRWPFLNPRDGGRISVIPKRS